MKKKLAEKKIKVKIPGFRRIAIIGGTFSGNKGASAMLESTIYNLRHMLGGQLSVDVISVYPAEDRKHRLPPDTTLIAAPPLALVFMLPFVSACYATLRKLGLPRGFMRKWPLLDAVASADAILDIEGISFVDGRPAALLYNMACSLPGIFCGTPVLRLSQAIGPLKSIFNRIPARFILKRCYMTFARGPATARQLEKAGITRFKPAADLAFILDENFPGEPEPATGIPEGEGPVIGAAPSQVLADNLSAKGIDLAGLMASLLDRMIDETGGRAVLIAHSWLGPEKISRNNDYHICKAVLEQMRNRDRAVFIDQELSASGLREVISRFDSFVACRFHAMISSLCRGVPCVVPAWSHKYREVMDEFGLGRFVIDMDSLSVDNLADAVAETLKDREELRPRIAAALPPTMLSSLSQLEYVADLLGRTEMTVRAGKTATRLYGDIYKRRLRKGWAGYSAEADIREGAASGGLVTTLLIDLLERGEIDGAITARTVPGSGGLRFETVLCRTPAEILDCRTSIYSDFSHSAGIIDILKETEGRFAAVALPCQWTSVNNWLETKRPRAGELTLRIGLWCGHATHRRLLDDFLRVRRVEQGDIERFWYRKGRWRGATEILMKDGSTVSIPFSHGYGLFQNLYVDCMGRCLSCEDHFANDSDISFGDAWLPEMKSRRIKHSMAVSLTEKGDEAGSLLVSSDSALAAEIPPVLAVQSQKRAVIWHTYGTAGRGKVSGIFGLKVRGSGRYRARWNDSASAFMILLARQVFAGRMRPVMLRLPWPVHYVYMLTQKTFLNF